MREKYSHLLLLLKVQLKENGVDMIRSQIYSLVRKNGVYIFVSIKKRLYNQKKVRSGSQDSDVRENEKYAFNLSSNEVSVLCVCVCEGERERLSIITYP